MLTEAGCRARQARFLARLEALGVDGALISAPRDIHYFTGVLPELPIHPYPSLLFLGPGRPSWLLTGLADGEPVVDERRVYPINLLYTLNPDHHRRAGEALADLLKRSPLPRGLGYQREALPRSLAAVVEATGPTHWVEVDETLQEQQLRKDPDEVECIARAVRATLAGYSRAQQVIAPRVSELVVMTECQAAAQRHSGEVHYYNGDFRSGQFGGFARPRAIQAGELYIIDAWSDLGGYWCDMARTWVVGGPPSDLQASVYEHIARILRAVPEMARPGRDTSEFWRELDARVREHPFLADVGMKDHGGHGVGARVHEMPDLNRDRGGVFEVGNVFTCEPAAYHPDLNFGVRLEDVFVLRETGAEPLVPYPLSLVPDPACPVP